MAGTTQGERENAMGSFESGIEGKELAQGRGFGFGGCQEGRIWSIWKRQDKINDLKKRPKFFKRTVGGP